MRIVRTSTIALAAGATLAIGGVAAAQGNKAEGCSGPQARTQMQGEQHRHEGHARQGAGHGAHEGMRGGMGGGHAAMAARMGEMHARMGAMHGGMNHDHGDSAAPKKKQD